MNASRQSELKGRKVIITGAFRFPEGDAAAARVLGIGKAIRELGREVVFAGWEADGRVADQDKDGFFSYQKFRYVSLNEFRTESLPPFKRLWRYLAAGSRTLAWLRSVDPDSVEAVIAYHGGSLFLIRLAAYCKSRGIRLIVDCTEWYDGNGLPGGRFGIAHLDNEFRLRVLNRLIGNVIAISVYLEDYYSRRGCKVVRVPPTIDFSDGRWRSFPNEVQPSETLRLVYAGVPAKKDLLGAALYGLRELKRLRLPVVLNLLGPTKEELLRCVDGDVQLLRDIQEMIFLHGRISQSDVPKIVSESDFSILLRPNKRYANAGFSTKLVESLAAGVPVLANQTGDICRYVRDGQEGLILKDHSAESFVEGVLRAHQMPTENRLEMRAAARLMALNSFDCLSYSNGLSFFFTHR